MNKIIILGCGYIGTNVANYIVENYSEKVYVMGIWGDYCNHLNSDVLFISKRVEDIDENDKDLFDGAIVIDAVGNTNATSDILSSSEIFIKNCESKIQLIKKLDTLRIKKYIFLSSGGTVYNDSQYQHSEDENVDPKNIYALEKVMIENYLKIYSLENTRFSYLILRISNPYGGIVSNTKKQGIIDVVISKIKNDEVLEFYGDLDNVRDYIYIDDVAYSIYNLGICDKTNDIYNVSTGIGTSVQDLFDILEQISGKKISIVNKTIDTVNIKTSILNNKKIQTLFENHKMIALREGLERIYKTR